MTNKRWFVLAVVSALVLWPSVLEAQRRADRFVAAAVDPSRHAVNALELRN